MPYQSPRGILNKHACCNRGFHKHNKNRSDQIYFGILRQFIHLNLILYFCFLFFVVSITQPQNVSDLELALHRARCHLSLATQDKKQWPDIISWSQRGEKLRL